MELEKINFTCVAEIVLHIEKKNKQKYEKSKPKTGMDLDGQKFHF